MKVIAARQTLTTTQTVEYIYHIVIHHHIHTMHTNCLTILKTFLQSTTLS